MVLAWLAGIVLTVLMLKRGGGKAEKLLLTGCAVMFVDTLFISIRKGILPWLMNEHGMTLIGVSSLHWTQSILSLAGIVCLVIAFWMKFRSSLRSDSKLKGGDPKFPD